MLAGVSNDGVATAMLGKRADPPTVRPCLHRDRRARMLLEKRSERFLVVVQFTLEDDLAATVESDDLVLLVPQVESNFRWAVRPSCRAPVADESTRNG